MKAVQGMTKEQFVDFHVTQFLKHVNRKRLTQLNLMETMSDEEPIEIDETTGYPRKPKRRRRKRRKAPTG